MPDKDPLGGEHCFVDVPMPGFQAWTYEICPLYVARVKITKDGRVLDEMSLRFGMREIGVRNRGNVTEPDEGRLQQLIRDWFEAAGQHTTTKAARGPGRCLRNTGLTTAVAAASVWPKQPTSAA